MDLPKRKPNRLPDFDYSTPGYYFITVCTHKKRKILCDIVGEGLCALPSVKLTSIGKRVDEAIHYINTNKGIIVDKYVIMPNHIHLIVAIQADEHFGSTGGRGDPPLQVCDVIGRMKSFTDRQYEGTLWQRSFHDHIIRNEQDYLKIWTYIDGNPARWREDCFYTEETDEQRSLLQSF